MKRFILVINTLIIIFQLFILIVSLLIIIDYSLNSETYMLGSESMVSAGGFKYHNEMTYLSFPVIHISLSIAAIILCIKQFQGQHKRQIAWIVLLSFLHIFLLVFVE
jgi:hypothetical protein